MVTLRLGQSDVYRKLLGYSALGIYMLSIGLYISSAISTEFHGVSIGVCLAMLLFVLLIPPYDPEHCVLVSEKHIRVRISDFHFRLVRWHAIRSITVFRHYIELQTNRDVVLEIPLHAMNYMHALHLKQHIKAFAGRKGVHLTDTECKL